MEKQNTFICWLLGAVLSLVASIAMCTITAGAYHAIDDYRAEIAQAYGTNRTVYFRERSGEPLYRGEPAGAYLYAGYVGYGMTDEDVKNLQILKTGADEELSKFCRLDERAKLMFGLSFVPIILLVLTGSMAYATHQERKRE